jgi:hypothetical protein
MAVTHSIGSGKNYSTIQAWEDAQGSLSGVHLGELYDSDYSEAVTIAGQTGASSVNYMKLAAHWTNGHGTNLRAGPQLHGPVANASNAHVIQCDTDHTQFEGLNFNRWHGSSTEAIRINGADGCYVERSLFWGACSNNADAIFFISGPTSTNELRVSNCFMGWLGRTAVHVQGDQAGTIYCYNVTAVFMRLGVNQTDDGLSGVGAIGEDLNDAPQTNGIDWQIKNTYAHVTPDPVGQDVDAFTKGSTSRWTNCENNSSHDTSAPGTSAQDNAAVADQFARMSEYRDIGENAGSHLYADTYDSYINSGDATQNYGFDNDLHTDNSPIKNILIRWDLTIVPDEARVLGTLLWMKKHNTTTTNQIFTWFRNLRAWTNAGVTYNKYDGTNDWTTAGALGLGSDVETVPCDGAAGNKSCGWDNQNVSVGEWFVLSGGRMVEWVQDAIDGIAPGAYPDSLDIISRWITGTTLTEVRSAHYGTDGNYPEVSIHYDTADDPLNPRPVSGGVLDGNGTDLSSDGDYPISIDISGATRDDSWDIGAFRFDEDPDPVPYLRGGLLRRKKLYTVIRM